MSDIYNSLPTAFVKEQSNKQTMEADYKNNTRVYSNTRNFRQLDLGFCFSLSRLFAT